MPSTSQFIALVAETSVHAGAGGSSGYVDLPIQREAHTDWPCIYGSGVKGALRAAAAVQATTDAQKADIRWLFGPETDKADEGAGALIVTDARLLLLPVRSLTSHYRWVTCPALLARLAQDLKRLGIGHSLPDPLPQAPQPAQPELPAQREQRERAQALVPTAGDGPALYLDEINFTAVAADMAALCAALHALTGLPVAHLQARLAIVHDDRFAYLARYATPVNTHVKLGPNKTVEDGALWTEESLPPDTVLYIGAHLARRGGAGQGQDLSLLRSLSFPLDYLQVGGNETVGMGFMRAHVHAA